MPMRSPHLWLALAFALAQSHVEAVATHSRAAERPWRRLAMKRLCSNG